MSRKGKKYLESSQLVDKGRAYPPREALEIASKASFARFDETVELHLRMGVDPRQAEQQVRGSILLPNGLGTTVRVLVFAQGDAAQTAKDAGAEYVADDELIKRIEGGWVEFDVAIATPDMMGKIGTLGRVIGRKGLMPNPRSGTVVSPQDIPKAINEARMGRVEFRLDRAGIIHLPIGKISFDGPKLLANLATLIDGIVRAKPPGAKGQYIRSAYLSTTMGPGIMLDLPSALSLQVE